MRAFLIRFGLGHHRSPRAHYAPWPLNGYPVGQRISRWVAANWRPMFNAEARLYLDGCADDLRFAASMPLIADERLVGVLAVYSAEPFGDAQARRLETITPHVAATLAAVADAGQGRLLTRDLKVVARR
jgi:hypothetical protein